MSELLEKFKTAQQEVHLPPYESCHPISSISQKLLASLNPEDQETLPVIDAEFSQRDLPTLHTELGRDFSESITQEGIVSWLANAPASQATHMLEWYNNNVRQLQRQLTTDKFLLNETSINYMQHLIGVGIHSYTTIAALYHSLNTTPVKAIGSLASHGNLGYFNGEHIGLATASNRPGTTISEALKETYFHEHGHVIGDLPELLDEAIVTHNTHVAMNIDAGYDGQPNIMNPIKRRHSSPHHGYTTLLQAVGVLMEHADVGTPMLTEAHVGGRHSSAYREADCRLTTTHSELTGTRGGFKRLLADYAFATSYGEREALLRKTVRQLYSASVGKPALSTLSVVTHTSTSTDLLQ